jgi:hypothetical protein
MRTPLAVLAALLISSAALAQSTNAPSANTEAAGERAGAQAAQAQSQPTGRIAQRIRSNLEQAGFTDIRMMPSSFLVRARDRDGNPVMMVVNPDSVTAVSEIGGGNQGSGQTTGMNSGRSESTDSSGAGSPSERQMPESGSGSPSGSPHSGSSQQK